MAHAYRPGRARHRRRVSARVIRFRYTASWLVILVCLDAFFLQGMVSSIRMAEGGDDTTARPGHGGPAPVPRPQGGGTPAPPAGGGNPGGPGGPGAGRPDGAGRPGGGGRPGGQPTDRPDGRTVRRSYRLTCGTVTLAVSGRGARLLAVAPRAGWVTRSARGTGWLRVELAAEPRRCTLIADWRGHPPRVRHSDAASRPYGRPGVTTP